jgi:hypothetical protein
MLMGQPLHLAVGPVALGGDLGRAELAVVLEQCGEQHRLVADMAVDTGQRFG